MSTAPIQINMCHWKVYTSFMAPHYTAQIKKQSHIALWMQKYQSTLHRKVLLMFVQLQTYSMLHTNTRNMYINQCVCMYALPSHRQLRPTVQYKNILWSSSPFKCQVWVLVQFIDWWNRTQSLMGEVWRCRCGWGGRWGGVDGPCGLQVQSRAVIVCAGVSSTSGMDLEGQQLLRVHVVERAQVGQFEQQLGEDCRLVGVVLGDQASQGADQRLLQCLHRVHVLDAWTIWKNRQWQC